MAAEGTEAGMLTWLAAQHAAMIDLLARVVNIDSGSTNKRGVDEVGAVVRDFLAAHGVEVAVVPKARHGDCLRATVAPGAMAGNGGQKIVLMGHRDTVFPDGEAARRPFTIHDGLGYGPGVMDMKAGLVMNCFVLAALAKFGGAPVPVVGLFTGDEEIASPDGRPFIEAEARDAMAVLNSEPARLSGNVVTGRKGGVFSRFRITGRAAHSGLNFSDGISAIEELARKVQAIHALSDVATGITVNVGLVRGGQSVNTVAPWAEGQIDLRFIRSEQRDAVMARIEDIIGQSYVPGTTAVLSIDGEFVPLVQSPASARLFDVYARAAARTGFQCEGEFAGSCADSGFTAAMGVPTLCCVGPEGFGGHTDSEYVRIDTLVPRAQACVRAILDLAAS
jgi:glutamate carboxypeptidase